jgi:hypothetical protein
VERGRKKGTGRRERGGENDDENEKENRDEEKNERIRWKGGEGGRV